MNEIRKTFRKSAHMYHPDINTDAGAEAKFKDVNEAYEVLKDPDERAAYDQLGQKPPSSRCYEPPPGWDNEFSFSPGEPGDAEGSVISLRLFSARCRTGQQHGG